MIDPEMRKKPAGADRRALPLTTVRVGELLRSLDAESGEGGFVRLVGFLGGSVEYISPSFVAWATKAFVGLLGITLLDFEITRSNERAAVAFSKAPWPSSSGLARIIGNFPGQWPAGPSS
jgi:hypothetical protein